MITQIAPFEDRLKGATEKEQFDETG